jgi:folylpolyglutamate synthase/dihydropteroate synthase
VGDIFAKKKVISVVGIKKGKEAVDILKEIVKISDTIILTQFAIHFDLGDETSIDLKKLSEILKGLNYSGKVIIKPLLSDALKYAQESVGKDGMILITGSMYLVGIVKSQWPYLQKSLIS